MTVAKNIRGNKETANGAARDLNAVLAEYKADCHETVPTISKKALSLVDELKLISQTANLQSTSNLKCLAHDWLGTKLPPENMNRKQLYNFLLKEQQITTSLRASLDRLRSETEYVKTQTKHQERRIYDYAKFEAARLIKETKDACAVQVEEVEKTNLDLENETQQFKNLLTERAESEAWFARYLAEIQTAYHIAEARRLETKKNPATTTAAKIMRLVKTDLQASQRENATLKQRITEYAALFPTITEYVEELKTIEDGLQNDGGRSWLSDTEFLSLSDTARNQLVLDHYHDSHRKSKWQIGRDYELFIGHVFKRKGYTNIIQYGIEKKLEDLGIDIIATNPKTGKVAYIQCKRWSQRRLIRENTITQLYGGALIHLLNNNQSIKLAEFHICTSTHASSLAIECAEILGVELHETVPMGKYPSIKCKLGTDEDGLQTQIYHLPVDQMYDRTSITGKKDFYATTCEEAEQCGFRRAFRWYGA